MLSSAPAGPAPTSRDTLNTLPGWETWDCDEINLIWRHGNLRHPHDIFGAEQAHPAATSYIQRAFASLARRQNASVVLEKTCANSLRVPFIDRIFPAARYLYIVRDGRDVALSAAKRWTAGIELKYLAKKLRYAPLADIPRYGARFISNRIHQARSAEGRQAIWGPVLPGMAEMARTRPLIEVCAHQWAGCVDQADHAFAAMDAEKWLKIHYEDLVNTPGETLEQVLAWYDPALDAGQLAPALGHIRAQKPNPWAKHAETFTPEALAAMTETLQRHGYEAAA
ncbi:MAG: sulfotransferase [Pseudomonadota bacterium]